MVSLGRSEIILELEFCEYTKTIEWFKSVNFKVYELCLNQAANKSKKKKKTEKEEEKEKREEEKLYITRVMFNRFTFKNINTPFGLSCHQLDGHCFTCHRGGKQTPPIIVSRSYQF